LNGPPSIRQRRGEFVADAQTFEVALESTVTIVVCQEMDAVDSN